MRTKLHESERQQILAEKELEIRQIKLKTMYKTVLGLQHHFNNPLPIVTLSLGSARNTAEGKQEIILLLIKAVQSIENIQVALSGFSTTRQYNTETIDPSFGKMISVKEMGQS